MTVQTKEYKKEVRMAGPTRLLDMDETTISDIYSCLNEGICEIKYTGPDGEEEIRSCTLRGSWVQNDMKNDWVDHEYEKGIMVVWDMSGDEWRGGSWTQIPIDRITFVEQLTGVHR
tara:strand:+ start:27436 stop:27783 length:348 start_codon:yes stop_codon:yes gene_type:complete